MPKRLSTRKDVTAKYPKNNVIRKIKVKIYNRFLRIILAILLHMNLHLPKKIEAKLQKSMGLEVSHWKLR
jgi:hypothetical protein